MIFKPKLRMMVIEKRVGLPYEQCWGNSEICQKMNIVPEVKATVREAVSQA